MQMVKEIWAFQLPLRFRQDKAQAMLAHPRFRAAYDFLCLRAVASPELQKVADWWTQAQVAYVPVDMPKHASDSEDVVDSQQESTIDERPRRRRRRRS
jgi:poly(A) polymerase